MIGVSDYLALRRIAFIIVQMLQYQNTKSKFNRVSN